MSKFESLVHQYQIILNEGDASSEINVFAPDKFADSDGNSYDAVGFDYNDSDDEIKKFYEELKAFKKEYGEYVDACVIFGDERFKVIQQGLRVMWSSIFKE